MRRWLVIVGLGIALAGCVTPSIPIPPPEPALMTFEVTDVAASTATFAYPPNQTYEDAIVFLYNRDLAEGIITQARPDGSVGPTKPLAARLGDQVVVTFQLDEQTVSTCIRLRNGPQDPNVYCGP
ncbi:MAG: hypothetical protein H0T89_28625 [Deltaproteobacteria bacterium]|nr:hypothetical protein [Deltaproteobacteria bacterium]MDQ3300399.1 hypothetical protein [Myxococcota bacterium]